jgi:hypothetical protein
MAAHNPGALHGYVLTNASWLGLLIMFNHCPISECRTLDACFSWIIIDLAASRHLLLPAGRGILAMDESNATCGKRLGEFGSFWGYDLRFYGA